jgi:hypothetical protein
VSLSLRIHLLLFILHPKTGPDKYDHVVLGEEQLVDVELDRKTSVLEDRESLDTVSWDDHGFYSKRSRAAEATTEAGEKSTGR